MKKLLVLINVLVITVLNSFSADLFPMKPIRVRIAFDIAAPKYDCEYGFGICKATLSAGRIGGDGRNAGGECYLEEDVFHLYIFRDKITPELDRELSGVKYWEQQVSQQLPELWLSALEAERDYVIAAGNYELVKEKDFFLVRFNVR